ncbi:MAG: peptide-methionine (S)-S-oxide reductase MsrA [Bacteroidota bacterium]
MKTLSSLFLLFLMLACNRKQEEQTKTQLTRAKGTEKTATFAAGCFWSTQEGFLELKGVIKATSGYTGGSTKDPTYEEVSTGLTGHAEGVQVIYNPDIISFAQLVEAFFYMHDPTQLNRQGPDFGTNYRSIAFYRNAEEKKEIENVRLKFNRAKLHSEPIVTEIKAFEVFYPAEDYHQNYYRQHPNDGYVTNVCGPKLNKLRAALPELLKDKFR